MTNKDEEDRAVEFLQRAANGYKFFRATEPMFNPQLIHQFLKAYKREGYAINLPTRISDENQVITNNQLQIAIHDKEITRSLLNNCLDGQPFATRIIRTRDKPSAETYLFQLGVLSLNDTGLTHDETKEVDVLVPNLSVRHDYASSFLEYMQSDLRIPYAFMKNPTSQSRSRKPSWRVDEE